MVEKTESKYTIEDFVPMCEALRDAFIETAKSLELLGAAFDKAKSMKSFGIELKKLMKKYPELEKTE